MAKKKINIILIIIVLGLWGTAGYRTFIRDFFENKIIHEQQNQKNDFVVHQINKDTFKLEKINRDPFLNKQFHSNVIVPKKQVSSYSSFTPVSPKPKPNLNWPELSYYGYIQSKNQELVLLKVDSKLYKLKLNVPINGLTVKKIYKDSVAVFYNSGIKIIRLKQPRNR
ncbi:hypothetical protein OIU80_11680 [Flavobacterium sp. LS1R47]|uniref:Uncharacterized protein n=1 Tax=Flavobacterium frigoritolerans TaxID=2987686 RepID=A0A9X2ZKA1_9FLAO|nr:hypothetical protein [Flavobacterium frigoritolerans]MCV9932941.1 hypothetical protein [Flavobacterium frigoritolerans]